jgi:ribosome-associated toxin RatA of RatAB toxin-antitoxin module
METETSMRVRADPYTIFRLAAAVEDWPRILPHYRWVRVLRDNGSHRIVEMAARRDAIPVSWTAEQRLFPNEPRITFRHIRGVTRGMDVAWTFTREPDGVVRVRIWHRFCPHWPLVPDRLVHRVVGQFFVNHIARKTLRRISELAEQGVVVGQ